MKCLSHFYEQPYDSNHVIGHVKQSEEREQSKTCKCWDKKPTKEESKEEEEGSVKRRRGSRAHLPQLPSAKMTAGFSSTEQIL